LASATKANRSNDGAEVAELNDAVLSVVAHELGGIAGALDLRAEALASTIAPRDNSALRTLAEELRGATRALRLIRAADASGMLNPAREQSLADWWRLASKLTRVLLPRGTVVDARFDDARLAAPSASALTWIWLSACKELAEKGIGPPGAIVLRGGPGKEAGVVLVTAEIAADQFPKQDGGSRWQRHAAAIAVEIGAPAPEWKRSTDVVLWKCTVPGPST
jgi:hypothetical protein